ncbi:MAG UNVERIFIED_CONTAM: hypothetical protein LVR18_46640 [Planctomycetaceae bacterium]|jgi:hypothetical protein
MDGNWPHQSDGAVMAVGQVTTEDGRAHNVSYTSFEQNDQIIVLVDPGRMNLRLERNTLLAVGGTAAQLGFEVQRGSDSAGPLQVELVLPRHMQGISCDAVQLTGQQSTGVLTLRFAADNVGPLNMPLLVRATTGSGAARTIAEATLTVLPPKPKPGLTGRRGQTSECTGEGVGVPKNCIFQGQCASEGQCSGWKARAAFCSLRGSSLSTLSDGFLLPAAAARTAPWLPDAAAVERPVSLCDRQRLPSVADRLQRLTVAMAGGFRYTPVSFPQNLPHCYTDLLLCSGSDLLSSSSLWQFHRSRQPAQPQTGLRLRRSCRYRQRRRWQLPGQPQPGDAHLENTAAWQGLFNADPGWQYAVPYCSG